MKKAVALLLVFCLLVLGGCAKKVGLGDEDSKPVTSTESVPPVVEPVETFAVNPLTGVKNLKIGAEKNRPVAIMINNISQAQSVQCGINKADIVYETEVEGGITRLMVVYQDISDVGRIGTIRSCRYPYIDLAAAHNAVYIHCGQDPHYAKPHLSVLDDIDLGTGNYGVRIKNGLSTEHTLYTNGDVLWAGIQKTRKTENGNTGLWQNFAAEDETITPTDGIANRVDVSFSASYCTNFVYDANSGRYTRYFNNTLRKDYLTGKSTTMKNIFVLKTSIYFYPDGKHRCVELKGGDGYYLSNGKYQKITWKKGNTTAPMKFYDATGNELKINAGDSWVCLMKKDRNVTFK